MATEIINRLSPLEQAYAFLIWLAEEETDGESANLAESDSPSADETLPKQAELKESS